jgi:hypothetical protein
LNFLKSLTLIMTRNTFSKRRKDKLEICRP